MTRIQRLLSACLALCVTVAVAVVLGPASARAADQVLWNGDWETGGVPHGTECSSTGAADGPDTASDQYLRIEELGGCGQVTLATSPTRDSSSRRSGRFHMAPGKQRSQAVAKHFWKPTNNGSTERWFGVSLYFAPDWDLSQVSGSKWCSLVSFRVAGSNGSMNVSCENGGRLALRRNTKTSWPDGLGLDKIDMGPIEKGKWVDYVFHIKFSTTANGALREVYRNGMLMGRKTSMNSVSANEHRFRVGVYQSTSITADRTLYVDNVKIGTSYAAADPARGTAPAPAPTKPSPSPTTPAPGPSPTAPAPSPVSPVSGLKTGFEKRAGSSWTTLDEEQTFLKALDAASDRVYVSEVGRSVKGRPIQLVTVGPSKTKAEVASGVSALLVCSQHGNEPAGREACLQRVRDHAASGSTQTLLVIPTANPDGVARNTRANGSGKDINRSHDDLSTPEARAIAAVMTMYKPDILHDAHEYSASGEHRVRYLGPLHSGLRVSALLRQVTRDLGDRYARTAIQAAGYTTGYYGSASTDGGVLRNAAALRKSASLLIESPRMGTLTPARRVAAHRAGITGTLRMLHERAGELAAATK